MRILAQEFFNRPTLRVAKDLLGKFLVRKIGGKTVSGMITEVEAYDGFKDQASHAHRGKTARNFPMFGPAGRWYVYFIYGNYWMINIVTGPKDYPAAILIRGVSVVLRNQNERNLVLNGPGKLTKFFKVDKRFNNLPANRRTGLWIENRGIKIKKSDIKSSPRIGVSYAGPVWSKKKWRYRIVNNFDKIRKFI